MTLVIVVVEGQMAEAIVKNVLTGHDYRWNGARRRLIPDFLNRLANGKNARARGEGAGLAAEQGEARGLARWVLPVNEKGGFGTWAWDVVFDPAKMPDVIHTHAGAATPAPESASLPSVSA